MSSSANEPGTGSCLVARAMPCTVSPAPIRDLDAIIAKSEPSKEGKSKAAESADALAESLRKLSMNSNSSSLTMLSGSKKSPKAADPADFVTLQSLRSSALARKTNTTSKFGRDGAALFADLLHNEKEEKAAAEVKEVEKKPEEEKKADEKKEESVAKESAEKENQKSETEKPKAVDEPKSPKAEEDGEKAEASEDYLLFARARPRHPRQRDLPSVRREGLPELQ
ncbi:Nuclear factor NF-kappa-B subunit [Aphelenchoides fujianensis]|nr:Nuclear factor NF-kappa-B subunit [Aphelenchoides fujianensis]